MSSPSNQGKEVPVEEEDQLTKCLFEQYRMFVGGIGLGAAYGVHTRKGVAPMMVAGVAGSVADLVYGYYFVCREESTKQEEPH